MDVKAGTDSISVGHLNLKVFAIRDPGELDWNSVGAQIVVESTGHFTDATKAAKRLRGSVKKVIVSAPASNEDVTLVLGVNNDMYVAAKHNVISNASCTTNCLAPVTELDTLVPASPKGSRPMPSTAIRTISRFFDFPHEICAAPALPRST